MQPPTHPRVLVACETAALAERIAGALADSTRVVVSRLDGISDQEAYDVIVSDHLTAAAALRLEGPDDNRMRPAVIGIRTSSDAADWPGVDAQLPEEFSQRELRQLVRLTAELAALRAERDLLAETHASVRQLAETDPLTQLPNRRAWQAQVSERLLHAARQGLPAWLALVDLDKFKAVNDRQGMRRGDEVLHEAAQAIATTLRRDDLVARLGGDEFGILLIGLGDQQLGEVLERVRAGVAASGIVTASIGWVRATASENESQQLAAAEMAMRRAKRDGGNRVVGPNAK